MKVSECMTSNVQIADPDDTIRQAARMMDELDAGTVPVGKDDRLVGMITDRDIAIRAVGQGKGTDCKISDVMTKDIRYCFEDEDVEHVLDSMGKNQVRRLPVLNRSKRLVGIISLGDIAMEGRADHVGHAVGQVSQPGGEHVTTH